MTKRLFVVAAFVIIALSLFFSPAFAAYSWVDDNGDFHITDYPKPVKREEPKKSTSAPVAPAEVAAPVSATPEVKQSPAQTAPLAPIPPQGQITPATATVPSSAGTLTMRPASPVSQFTPTQGVHDAMATAVTVSQLTTTAPLPAMQEQPRTALPAPQEPQQMPAAGIMAFVMAFFMIFLVLVAGMYVYFSLCLFLIAKKLNVPSPWTAWIPIVNIWTQLQAAGKPCWWVLLFFIPFVSIIVVAYVWMCIVENLGRNKWLGLLILIPIVNLVYIGVLAFSEQEQKADSHGNADVSGQEWKPAPDSSEEQE
jgi:hypothetical protein